MDADILKKVRAYVYSIFKLHKHSHFVYHDEHHTQDVVKAVKMLSRSYHLSDEDRIVLLVAAWFHDSGYFEDPGTHELSGAQKAQKYLRSLGVSAQLINRVKKCILATHLPQSPKNLLEQILCDADFFHFGTKDFFNRNELLRREFGLIHHRVKSPLSWMRSSLTFLTKHQYHTSSARALLASGKEKNILLLKRKIHKLKPALGKNKKLIRSQ